MKKSILLFIFIYLACIGCSAKKDTFLNARDGIDFSLSSQSPLYPVPVFNASNVIDFVSRPRPKPSFIGASPTAYEKDLIRKKEQQVQTLSLGYNTNQEASLYIYPYQPADTSALVKALTSLGFIKQEEYLYELQQEQVSVRLYFYPLALLLSLEKKKQSIEEFTFLDDIRKSFLQL